MASDENVNRDSCVHDPNFAIVCSFFEKFSSLCGIKHPPFSDLQQMIDSTEETSPELIDLHIRLMRKAKKNVNPERWERTLAKFCYLHHPQDSWELEQYGYKKLNFTQRLKILLCICEAQFDYNIKFKTDVNKLPIDELRLSPIGTDKDGIKYWIHLDEKLDLKLYKENYEDETFELIVTDRAGLVDLIETLRLGRDPGRKYEEPSEEEDDEDSEVGEEEEEEGEEEEVEGEEENVDEKKTLVENDSSVKSESNGEKSATEEALKTQPLSESQPTPVSSNPPVVNTSPCVANEAPSGSVHSSRADASLPKKPHVDVKTRRFDKSPEVKLRKDKVVVEQAPKQLNPEEFAQHIEKLKSEKILLPLLSSPLPFPEPPKGSIDSLKTKINMKFNMIKPVLTNEVLMSKIEEVKNNKDLFKKVVVKKEDNTVSNYVMQMNKGKESTSRAGKPGLKLEQILKSKLALKLAANEPTPESSAVAATSTTSTSNQPAADSSKTEPPATDAEHPKSTGTPIASQSTDTPTGEPSAKRKLSQGVEIEAKKPKLDDANSQPAEDTKNQSQSSDNNAGEIEEPLMLVTGVGSGAECQSDNPCENQDDGDEREFVLFVNGSGSGNDCNSPNDFSDDDDEREFCMFISGPGNGVECTTGNNESTAEEASDKEKPPATLTHKVENILSSKSEVDGDRSGTSVGSNEDTPKKTTSPASDDSAEKKKPKLWTIDAICNSNSSKDTSDKEDISCFPNFSFNKDKKPEVGYRNEFSFFNMPRAESKENDAIPTNFYFGSDTQMPPYVAPDARNTNNVKATKSHNVKDIVQLDGGEDKPAQAQVYSTFTNSHSEQAFNLCTRQSSAPAVTISTESEPSKGSENVYSDVMSLSTSNEVKPNQNESKNSTDAINRKETLSLVEYPSSSPENSQDVPDDDKIKPQSEANSSTKLVEDESLPKEAPSITTDHDKNIPEPVASSETNESIEPINEASVPSQESKPDDVPSGKDIPTVDEAAAENETLQKDKNVVKDVPEVTHDKPEPELGPSLDSTKESSENDPSSKDHLVDTQIEASQPETPCEKDVVSPVDINVQKSAELVVEPPAESTPPEKSLAEIPSQPVEETLPKSELIRESPPEPEPIQNVLLESQPTPQTTSEPTSTQEALEPAQIVGIVEESKSTVPETDEVALEKEQSPPQPAESLSSEKHDSKTVQEKLDDQPDEAPVSKCESPESDDDCCAPPSPPSPEPVIDNKTSSKPAAAGSPKDISTAESNDNEKSNEVKTDLAKTSEKVIQEPVIEPVIEKPTSQPEKTQQEPESAIVPTSVEISKPIEEPKPQPDDTVVENQQPTKETSPTPLQASLKASESESKPNEQIIEQSTTQSNKEKSKLTKEKPKLAKDTTPAADKTPKPTEKPEKKSKKAKIAAEEATTPSPVLRASSRIGTRSAGKNSITKKDEEEEEDDRKSNKMTPSKAKAAAELKADKKSKAAAKAAAKAAKQAAEEEKKVETPVEPVVVKKPGRGRKKKIVDPIPVIAKPTKAPSTENSSDENASDNEGKSTAKEVKKEVVAVKETKLKTPSKVTPKKEKKQEHEADKKPTLEADNEEEKKPEKTPKTPPSKKKAGKRGWFTDLDVSNLESASSTTPIRQSRRIAQLKIKEQAEGKYVEQDTPTKKTPKAEAKAKQQTPVKKNKLLSKKATKAKAVKDDSDGDDSTYEKSTPSKKKRKKKDLKKKLKSGDSWKARSDSSSEEEAEEDDHFYEDEDDEEIALNDASDHEFSPESDLEDEDFQPVKRARTAHSKPKTEEDKSEHDDLCCQKCRTAEQPEWILLCDKCDEGWHASCLRPPLLSIPEGDWFCPPCQHNLLINSLHKFLKTYDKKVKKRDNEELRRQRLQYVGISTTNIIADFSKISPTPDEPSTSRKKASAGKNDISDGQSSDEEEESEPDEPLYTLRVRRQANVSYTLKEYDEMMNSAIQRELNEEETEEVPQLVPAAPEQTKPEAEPVADEPEVEKTVKPEEKEDEEKSSEEEEEEEEEEAEVVPPLFRNIRKKHARLTKLDVSSDDDHYSDEDFKGSSAEDYDDDEYGKSETDSDEARYRKSIREPVRRSTRARVTRYDNDFINDDDSDEDDFEPKKKKKKSRNSDSDSEEEDSTWGKKKRNKYSRAHKSSSSKKKRRRVVFDGDSDEEKVRKEKKPKKTRITYGLDVEEDNYPQRRTRGKKINYLENLGSDSEEDNKITSKSRKILSDDDDYVNEDEEEDHKSPSKSAIGGAGDHAGEKEKPSGSVLENGTKSDVGDCGDDAKTDSGSLHELIASNNTGVIRTYGKTTATATPVTNVVAETTGAYQNSKLEPIQQPISDANDLAAANKLTPLSMPPQMTPMVVPPAEPLQVYSGMVKEEGNQMAPKKMDCTNPSLEGMQSMAQSLPQMMSSPSNYSMARKMMPIPGDGAQYAPPNPYGDVGMGYEDAAVPEGMPGPPPPHVITDTQHPLRGIPPSGPPEGVRLGQPNPAQMQMGSRPPHLPPGVGPPPYMGSMMPHNPVAAMMHRGPMPPMMPMSPQMAAAMHMRGPRPQHGPGPMPGMPPMGMNQSPPNPIPNQPMENEPPPKKRGARGKGKKQLEMERMKREAEAAAAAAAGQESPNTTSDEMIPLHMLKPLSGPDMNPTAAAGRPPGAPAGVAVPTTAYNSSPPPNFANYPPPPGATMPASPNQMARLPFSTASSTSPGAVTLSVGNNPSKRVKITPTRMRMPGSSPTNVLRFPPRPGQPPQIMHRAHPPMDPSPSGGGLVTVNSSPLTSTENAPAAAPGTPPNPMVGAEVDAKKRPPSASAQPAPGSEQHQQQPPPQPQQYYQPPGYPPMPPSANQMSRGGFNPRAEFAGFPPVAQKPMPPPMYSHPAPMATTGAPTTVISRPTTTNASVISGPIPTTAAGTSPKPDSVNSTTAPAYSTAPPYATTASPGSISTPTSKPTNAAASPVAISTAAGAVPPSPPTSAYQALHMKQLPPHAAHSTAPPYNAAPPYYAVASMIPNSYPPPPRPPITSAYGPPPGSMAFPPRQAGFGKSPSPYGAPPPAGPPPPQDQSATGSAPPSDYQTASQNQPQAGFQYPESIPAAASEAEFQAAEYEEEGTPATADEQPSGEFGGLVSYFSSQHEDDLDA